MVCKRCKQRGKTWEGSDPKCAFTKDYEDYRVNCLEYLTEEDKILTRKFDTENWNCATMNALRDLIDREYEKGLAYHRRDDLCSASIGVLRFETENYQGYLILTWYKERGQTGQAIIMCDDERRELTEDIAEEILNEYGVN
jgi:hypothetical protein